MTYDTSLGSDKDYVRFLIGDTESPFILSDSEISAVILEENCTGKARKYFAAASCLSALQSKWIAKSKGYSEKQVSKLRIKWGSNSQSSSIKDRINELREEGSYYLRSSSGSPMFIEAM